VSIASPSAVKDRIRVAYEADAAAREARAREAEQRDAERIRLDTAAVLAAIEDATNSAAKIPFDVGVMIRRSEHAFAWPHTEALKAGLRALNDAGWTNMTIEVTGGLGSMTMLIHVADPTGFPPKSELGIDAMVKGTATSRDGR
jgi:hypothetical protein